MSRCVSCPCRSLLLPLHGSGLPWIMFSLDNKNHGHQDAESIPDFAPEASLEPTQSQITLPLLPSAFSAPASLAQQAMLHRTCDRGISEQVMRVPCCQLLFCESPLWERGLLMRVQEGISRRLRTSAPLVRGFYLLACHVPWVQTSFAFLFHQGQTCPWQIRHNLQAIYVSCKPALA